MERAIKSYDPDLPEDPITKTFDAIQNQVHTSLLDNAPNWYLVGIKRDIDVNIFTVRKISFLNSKKLIFK